MPKLMTIVVGADFQKDEITELLYESISQSGCISIKTESKIRGVSSASIKNIFSSMSGVTCTEEKCCITDFSVFSAGMKKISGGD